MALNEIEKAVEENFENESVYLKRHDEFFDLYDTNNCERNYRAIKELK